MRNRFIALMALSLGLTASGLAQSGWGSWQPLNDAIDIRFKTTTFKFGNGQHEIYWQLRSRYADKVRVDYSLTFDTDEKVKTTIETVTLLPGQQTTTGGSWTIARSVTAFKALKVAPDGPAPAPGSQHAFSRPDITGVPLDHGCIELLKSESDKLELAGATKETLAWSPLIGLGGESNAIHAGMSVGQANWNELAQSFTAVNKLVLYSLATETRKHANSDEHFGSPKAKAFWNVMADFYQFEAER